MEIQEIEVTIDNNGQVKIHVHGTSGTQCLDLTKELEDALGGQLISREFTYEAGVAEQQQVIQSKQKIKR